MKTKIALIGALSLFFLGMAGFANAAPPSSGQDGKTRVDPVRQDHGNTWRPISVPMSTNNVVLISSAPENAKITSSDTITLQITNYRERLIINTSTTSKLVLYPTPGYNQFSGTFSVVLGSGTNGTGLGDSYVAHHQDDIWGIWSPYPAACIGCAGAGGSEDYFQNTSEGRRPKKR